MKIRELYQKDKFDETIDLMYMLAALCGYYAGIKIEAYVCQSEETKGAMLNIGYSRSWNAISCINEAAD